MVQSNMDGDMTQDMTSDMNGEMMCDFAQEMAQDTMQCCCSSRTKERDEKEYKALINRLSRIEGQIRGIRNMVENDAYCTDILVQVSAASSALNGFTKELLSEHIKGCVANDIKEGRLDTVDELVEVLKRLMK